MSRQDHSWQKPKGSGNKVKRQRTQHPPNLRGKEIGLYYRDLAKKSGKSMKDYKRELLVNLRIPKQVESVVLANLQKITNLAQNLNIQINKTELPKVVTKEEVINVESIKDIDTQLDKSMEELETSYKIVKKEPDFSTPGTSADFIPINKDIDSDYGSGSQVLSFRGGGDYKYSYKDILTGTFDEKLNECLSKGITINICNEDISNLNKKLMEEYKSMVMKRGFIKMLGFREKLPAYKKSAQLVEVINNNQVIVISGETGCGKSTQVPQIILDNAIINNKGGNIKILVTQPRRIAASSLAYRVAEERAEHLGNSVGYAVRLEKVDARARGSMTFCTTGILLAELEVDQGLVGYSHVILDEVHERDVHVDLSMCILKKVLQKRKDLKLILMSATIDAESLSAYFNGCPMMHIEGLAYPVEDVYLEDILQLTKYQLPDKVPKRPQSKWMKYRRNHRQSNNISEKDIQYKAWIAPWLETKKKVLDREVYFTLQDSRIEDLNVELICELLINISRGPPGAILVFLPGIGEITKLIKLMDITNMFPQSSFNIYPLHSKLPSLEQRQIFERPPEGVRKIIVATNIAETSITIDDIVYVVDSAKIKMSGLNVEEKVSTLKVEWAAKANLHQRRGRAGRCQPGVCYHLLTSHRQKTIPDRLLPELQRSNLLEPVLTIKRLRLGKAADALKLVPSPPDTVIVDWAVKHLQQCGALDSSESLTPLGWHLARLPVHPAAGKLLLLGALFGCLDRAATVAAVWGFKDPFQLVIGKEKEVDQCKRDFARGEPSDHVAISEAVLQWERCPSYSRKSFAYNHFLSNNTVQLISEMKSQLGQNLKMMGFLASGDVRSSWENRNSENLSLFKAVIAASLYPNIATVKWIVSRNPRKFKPTRIKVSTPEDLKPVAVHPSSVMAAKPNASAGNQVDCNPGANWLVYWLKQMSSDLFLLEVTLVYTLPLLFFGELQVSGYSENKDTGIKECDLRISAVTVRCEKKTAEMLFQLRSLLDQVLESRVSSDYNDKRCQFQENVLDAVVELITAEDEQAEYLGDDDQSETDHSDQEYGWNYKKY